MANNANIGLEMAFRIGKTTISMNKPYDFSGGVGSGLVEMLQFKMSHRKFHYTAFGKYLVGRDVACHVSTPDCQCIAARLKVEFEICR
jgi:hypothetical protein